MNWKEEFQKAAFLDELNKLAAGVTRGPIRKAVTSGLGKIKTSTITKLAKLQLEKGKLIYKSIDEQPEEKISDNSKCPYQLYSEDSAFGYKIAAFKGLSRTLRPRKISGSYSSGLSKGGPGGKSTSSIIKSATLKGKRYPSKEMKKEYDAANDSETIDLDSTTVFSPSYATNHMAIKV